MLEDLDRIEVVRGPGGALWGPTRSTGHQYLSKSAKGDAVAVSLTVVAAMRSRSWAGRGAVLR